VGAPPKTTNYLGLSLLPYILSRGALWAKGRLEAHLYRC
jgi:hypothetical protein